MSPRRTHLRALTLTTLLFMASLAALALLPRQVSAYTPRGPILIIGDSAFTAANGVTGGSGTAADPYIIDGWEINASTAHGIEVRNTNAYFVVRNVYIHSGVTGSMYGIYLNVARNGRVENANLTNNLYGIYANAGGAITLFNVTATGGSYGVYLSSTVGVNVTSSRFSGNTYGLLASGTSYLNVTSSTATSNSYGFYNSLTSYTNIRGSQVSSNSLYGIYFSSSNNVNSSANNITNNLNYGIYLSGAPSTVIADNYFSGNFYSIRLFSSSTTYVLRNRFVSNTYAVRDSSTTLNAQGNNVSGGTYGFYILSGTNSVIRNNTVTGTSSYATYLSGATGSLVEGNNYTNDYYGVYVVSSSSTIRNNGFFRGTYGIYVNGNVGNVLDGNRIVAPLYGIYVTNFATSTQVTNNFIQGVSNYGISIWSSASARVDYNNASLSWYGIYLSASGSATITNNTGWRNTLAGLYITGSSGHVVDRNNFSRNQDGIWLASTTFSRLTNNSLYQNSRWGAYLSGANNWTIDNNRAYGNQYGFYLTSSPGSWLTKNNASRNQYGVYLSGSSNVLLVRDVLHFNTAYGVYVTGSSGVLIHHNSFFNNTNQAFDLAVASNRWNLTYPGGGNFWSSYTGVDQCSDPAQSTCTGPDGFGDTPFALDADTSDYYPLMVFVPSGNTPPVAYFTVTPSQGRTSTNFTVDARGSWDLEDTSSALEVEWDWEGDGTWDTVWTTTKTAQHRYATTGIYTILVSVRDTGGLVTNYSRQVVVTVNQLPVPSFTLFPTSGDTLTSFSVDATPSSDSDDPPSSLQVRWDWNGDGMWDTGWSTSKISSHLYTQAGSYTVRLEVMDTEGLTNSTSRSVTVALAALRATMLANRTWGVAPLMVSFTSSVVGGQAPYTYAWDFGDGGTATTQNPSHTFATGGNFTVMVTVRDGAGQASTATQKITVSPPLTPPGGQGFTLSGWTLVLIPVVIGAALGGVLLLLWRRRQGPRGPGSMVELPMETSQAGVTGEAQPEWGPPPESPPVPPVEPPPDPPAAP